MHALTTASLNRPLSISHKKHRQAMLKKAIKHKTDQAMLLCDPKNYKDATYLPKSCKTLWSDVVELSSCLCRVEEEMTRDECEELTKSYWYYDPDDVEDIFYDV